MQEIFQNYSPKVQPISVDEAFLDITGMERLNDDPIELLQRLKNEMWDKMKLTCSVGVAPTRYLAKLASGLNKPNGLTIMDREKFKEVFFPKPLLHPCWCLVMTRLSRA